MQDEQGLVTPPVMQAQVLFAGVKGDLFFESLLELSQCAILCCKQCHTIAEANFSFHQRYERNAYDQHHSLLRIGLP